MAIVKVEENKLTILKKMSPPLLLRILHNLYKKISIYADFTFAPDLTCNPGVLCKGALNNGSKF